MTVPIATTTVTVATQSEPEPGEGITTATRATSVRAHIAAPNGTEQAAPGGGAERIDAILVADPIAGLAHTDVVTDDDTGLVYEVAWVTDRRGLGLDHVRAGLVKVKGRVAA